MKPVFDKIIFRDGKCALAITREDGNDYELAPKGDDNSFAVDCEIITDTVLHMLSNAYAAGYEGALLDARLSINRMKTKKPIKVKTSAIGGFS